MGRKITVGAAVNEALAEELRREPSVFLIGEDIGKFGGCFGITAGLYNEFPDRIFDTPISEGAPAYLSIGAAIMGKRPVFEVMFADFICNAYSAVAYEAPIFNYLTNGDIKCPVVFRTAQGGFVGAGSHHSNVIEGWFQNHPGMTIIAPTTAADTKGLLKAAIRSNNPILFLEHKALYGGKGEVPDGDYTIPIGVADVVKEGKDVTIVAWQFMRNFAQKAISQLEKEGVSVEFIDPRTIRPFDYKTLSKSVNKTGRLLVVHEHPKLGGVGESIAANISKMCFANLKKPVEVLGRAEVPIPAGPGEAFMFPSVDGIIEAVRNLVK